MEQWSNGALKPEGGSPRSYFRASPSSCCSVLECPELGANLLADAIESCRESQRRVSGQAGKWSDGLFPCSRSHYSQLANHYLMIESCMVDSGGGGSSKPHPSCSCWLLYLLLSSFGILFNSLAYPQLFLKLNPLPPGLARVSTECGSQLVSTTRSDRSCIRTPSHTTAIHRRACDFPEPCGDLLVI